MVTYLQTLMHIYVKSIYTFIRGIYETERLLQVKECICPYPLTVNAICQTLSITTSSVPAQWTHTKLLLVADI